MFSDKHWLEMFGILGIPNKSVEMLTFGDFLNAKEKITANANALQVSMYGVIKSHIKSCHQFHHYLHFKSNYPHHVKILEKYSQGHMSGSEGFHKYIKNIIKIH
jgi:hypothetical protein